MQLEFDKEIVIEQTINKQGIFVLKYYAKKAKNFEAIESLDFFVVFDGELDLQFSPFPACIPSKFNENMEENFKRVLEKAKKIYRHFYEWRGYVYEY